MSSLVVGIWGSRFLFWFVSQSFLVDTYCLGKTCVQVWIDELFCSDDVVARGFAQTIHNR